MHRISSGIGDLDLLIDYLRIGDNVVWEIDSGTSHEIFLYNFIKETTKNKERVYYISFNKSPQSLLNELGEFIESGYFNLIDCFTSGKGKNDSTFLRFYENSDIKNVIRFEHPENIEEFTKRINATGDTVRHRARYIFDSLTGMQELWGDEKATYNFFTFMCPRLYDLGTVAYWVLEKDAHSEKFKANLRHVTQVVLELYARREYLYIKAKKLDGREDREAFKPHLYEIKGRDVLIRPIKKETATDIGVRIKEVRTRLGISQKELADKIGLSASFISQVENNQISPSLSSFLQLCDALGVDPGNFFKTEKRKPWLVIKRQNLDLKDVEEGVKIKNLLFDDVLLAFIVNIGPKSGLNRHFFYRKSPEFIYIIKGRVTVRIGDFTDELNEGDGLLLKDVFPSQWRNETDEEVELLIVIPECKG
ncbi:MAG: helix-turn-helix domain-containing protein [Thermodesulfovibrionales bacterium]|nr:helix-turn-helix domain-containing protein [Thermodesulfovibrionales bacterium]